jgi:hypothetical protein
MKTIGRLAIAVPARLLVEWLEKVLAKGFSVRTTM